MTLSLRAVGRGLIVGALLLFVILGTWTVPATQAQPVTYDEFVYLPVVDRPDFVDRVVERTNYYRTQHGCPPITPNEKLHAAAQRHSDDMAENDFFGHTGSDGTSAGDRIDQAGYAWLAWAENVAAGYPTPEAVVDAWMASEGHRDNILRCYMEDIGVGYRHLENDTGDVTYRHYWTQVFAVPQ